MTVLQCILTTIIIDMITICVSMISHIKKSEKKAGTWYLVILSMCCTLFIGYNTIKAYRHGMYEMNISFSKMLQHTKMSPPEDKLPEDLSKSIIIYYKFGCSDCENVYKNLKNSVQDKTNIYWISTRSKQGRKLLEQYPVKVVPSGVYIYSDSTATSPQYVKKVLYTHDQDETILHTDNLNRLLELQADGR